MDKDKIIKKNRGNYSYVIRTMDEDGDTVFHVLKYVKTIDKTKSRKTVRKLIMDEKLNLASLMLLDNGVLCDCLTKGMKMQNKPTPEEVKNARVAAGLTLKEAADIFGYQLNSWQMKESAGKASRSLSIGEYQYLLLLANMHPSYRLVKK